MIQFAINKAQVKDNFEKAFNQEPIVDRSVVHDNYSCAKCNDDPIVGTRFECLSCKLNFCSKCQDSHDFEHPLTMFKRPIKLKEPENKVKQVEVKMVILNPMSDEHISIVGPKRKITKTWVIQNLSSFDWPANFIQIKDE